MGSKDQEDQAALSRLKHKTLFDCQRAAPYSGVTTAKRFSSTPDARLRYFKMLPAIAGRLQNVYTLSSLKDEKDGLSLYSLYLAKALESAQLRPKVSSKDVKFNDIIDREEIVSLFKELLQKSAQKGIQGVTQRDFLNELYLRTQDRFKTIPI